MKPGAAQTSPTSDFAEDGSSISEKSDRGDSTSSSGIEPVSVISVNTGNSAVTFIDTDHSVIKSVKTSKQKHPHHIPYDPMVRSSITCFFRFSYLMILSCALIACS